MIENNRYKFLLKCGDVEHVATPIYKELKKVWEQESGEIFFRQKLEGNIKFQGLDYDFIRSCSFGAEISLDVYKRGELYWSGYFHKIDCETDINHEVITVSPKPNDRYKLIMDKLNEEYDLLKHNPKMSDVSMRVRPMLQVYELGNTKIDVYISDNYHNKTVTPIYSINTDWNFGAITFAHCRLGEYDITSEWGEELKGSYAGLGNWRTIDDVGATAQFYMPLSNPFYRVVLDRYYPTVGNPDDNTEVVEIRLEAYIGEWTGDDINLSDQWREIAGYYDYENSRAWIPFNELKEQTSIPLYSAPEVVFTTLENFNISIIYARILYCNPNADSNITEDDTLCFSELYNTAVPVSINEYAYISDFLSDDETKYGRDKESGKYYRPIENSRIYEPVAQALWGNGISAWIDVHSITVAYTDKEIEKVLKDWISMYEAMRVLLGEIDPDVKISHTSRSSQFLYSQNNPVSKLHNQGEYFLLQKSNATKLEYDYAATKTPIKLSDILSWLKTINVYWDIIDFNGEPTLRVEHLIFYLNGGNYETTNHNQINLLEVLNPWNNKNYGYHTNRWKYEDVNTPTNILYKWMDEVSEPFEGEAMKAVERWTPEHQETRSTNRFTSDIDYIFANANDVSKDGFAIVQGYKAENDKPYKILSHTEIIDGRTFDMQNGVMSAVYFQRHYLPYDLFFSQAKITGGSTVEIKSVKKLRQNEVTFFLPDEETIDEYTVLTTEAGDGTIVRLEQDMSSEQYKAILKYENE